jgi:transketolase
VLDWKGPVYLRINRNDLPFVTPEDEPYHIGKVWKLREGSDVAVFASGLMVSKALEAAESLAKEGISVRVLNLSTIKPIDREAVVAFAAGVRAIVTVEEHNLVGGLGSAVVEALRRVRHAPVEFVGVQDSFGQSAENHEVLLRHFGLTAAAVAAAVRRLLQTSEAGQ